jgi:DNA polymerase I-like protein with 3'-5' exonuclease and polymerase domains
LIKPPPGYGLAYIDWKQQEFGIAAALSRDPRMQTAYASGDPYLAFAKQAGAVPQNATKASHESERELYKACVLAVQYGMSAEGLASRIGQPPILARELLRLHRETYCVFWRRSDAALDHAMLTGSQHTVFGWRVQVSASANPRSLRNFPMQANGAEMLRLACCIGTESGIEVCAPVHDAVLIAAPLERLDHDVARMKDAMRESSRGVLNGFELGIDAEIVRHPDRYGDPRGTVMWKRVTDLIQQRQSGAPNVAA